MPCGYWLRRLATVPRGRITEAVTEVVGEITVGGTIGAMPSELGAIARRGHRFARQRPSVVE